MKACFHLGIFVNDNLLFAVLELETFPKRTCRRVVTMGIMKLFLPLVLAMLRPCCSNDLRALNRTYFHDLNYLLLN